MSATPTGPSVPADRLGGGPEVSVPPGPDRIVPSWTDPVAVQASEAVGGPWGRHAVTGRARFWTPLRVCLLFTVVVLGLAWAKQAPCAAGNWTGSKQYTHFCYTDAVALFFTHGIDDGQVPYLDSAVEYPVLTGGLMQLAAVVARGWDGLATGLSTVPVESFYVVTCLLLSALALLVTRGVLGLAGRRPWDAAMVALSPLLLVHAFTNWDLLAVALTTLGMWAWARRHPVPAGVLIGLGIAAKLYPVIVLGVLFVLCLRAGRLRAWLSTIVAAGLAWLAVNLPVALAAPENWARFFTFSDVRPANPESVWAIALDLTGDRILDGPLAEGQTPSVLNATVAVLLLLSAAVVAWLALAAPLRPRLPQLAFLLVAAFLLLNKVWSPQFSLWLLPLAVLARPRWRSLLLWQATEVLVWMMTMLYYLGADSNGVGVEWFYLAVVVRDVAVLVLMALVVREVWSPDRDLVRRSWPGTDDPAGGVLDGAPDRWVLPRPVGRAQPARASRSRATSSA
ncbi:glycosyltransferase family 87 protein [Modestobacter marinus]|uniref:glycosyltransferase family 87 protein n=1 Tax=Modestobacter marinus TaxID=477641 RepID=UPI00201A38E1|nr:glycosyltransferase 87 family protein [Modestobacter marinus]